MEGIKQNPISNLILILLIDLLYYITNFSHYFPFSRLFDISFHISIPPINKQ
jgi:hypothetical protein